MLLYGRKYKILKNYQYLNAFEWLGFTIKFSSGIGRPTSSKCLLVSWKQFQHFVRLLQMWSISDGKTYIFILYEK
jgi:hypothetical protein